MYKSMLVATDGSPTAAKAVDVAIELAAKLGAQLHVATIYRAGSHASVKVPEMTGPLPEGLDPGSVAFTHAEAAASKARSMGVKSTTHALAGDPASELVALASKEKIDVIIVGNKGMRGAKRILGSVPNGVAHHAHCAVLIVNTT